MNREFLINILLLLGLNLLIKPFYIFGIEREVQNIVGAENYGLYFTLFNFTFLLQIINDFGLQNFNNRAISRRPRRLDKYLSNIFILKIVLGFLFIGITFLAARIAGYEENLNFFILFLCINHILISFNLYLRSNISGLGMYRVDSFISALDKTLLILICGVLLWGNVFTGDFQIEWFVYAQTCSLILTALTGFFILLSKTQSFRPQFNFRFVKVLLKHSFPYALVIFLMTVYTRIDAVMIERLLPNGKEEAGIYGAAFRLLDAANMIGFLFAGLLMPMFARLIVELKKRREELQSLVELSWQMVWAGALTLSLSVYFFRVEIMELLYDDATIYWGQVLGWLILSFIAMSGTYIFGTLLTANGSMRKMNILFLFSILINIVLNWLLITRFKAEGAAIATLATQFFALIMQMYLTRTELQIRFETKIFLKFFAFVSVVLWLCYLSKSIDISDWRLVFLTVLFGSICLSFLFRLINIPVLLSLLKSKVD